MITLDTARKIMKAIETYQGPMQADVLIATVAEETLELPTTITQVIEFLQDCRRPSKLEIVPSAPPAKQAPIVIDDTPLNLMDELQYNYKIAKAVLQNGLIEGRSLDAEETRKSLRTISAFMEQALKLQERLYNTQQLQRFQEAVLDTIATVDPVYRDTIIERMLEANL
jgi:hypothetical protein